MGNLGINDKMSSIEIAELTGKRHKDVMRSIRNMEKAWVKVCGRNFALTSRKVQMPNGGFKNEDVYLLTKKECLYISTKFNDEARAKLVARWYDLETGQAQQIVPTTQAELILQLAQQNVERERKMRELDSRQTKLETRMDEIEQRTSTDLKMSTIVGFASRHHIYVGIEKASAIGRIASNICKNRNIKTGKIPDPRFGTVKTYPDEVIREAFLKYYPNI